MEVIPSVAMAMLRSRTLVAAVAIFALALGLRLATLAEVRELPSFSHLLIDAEAYDAWARRIAAGDWIGDQVFYQAPAYPYFMAAVYRLTSGDHETLRVVQCFLGALSCVLLFGAAHRLFGFAAAVVAGVLLALYPPGLFFDTIVQKTSFGLFLTTLLLLALVSLQARPRPALAFAAGAALGLLALTRENTLVWLPVILVWIAWRFWGLERRRGLALIGSALLGLALTLGPVVLRNRWIGDSWAITTSQLGTNFWYGNGPDANGLYVPLVPGHHTPEYESPDSTRLAERDAGRKLTAGEVSNYWLRKGLDHVAAEPGRWLGLMAWKTALTWNAEEIPDTEDIWLHAEFSRVIRWLLPWLHFGVIAPLGLAGLALALRSPTLRRDVMVLPAMGVVYTAGVALFLVLARFRLPLVPMLLPFVGLLAARGLDGLRNGRSASLGLPLAVGLVAAVLCNLPLLDRASLSASGHLNLAVLALETRDLAAAERHLEDAAARLPDDTDVQLQFAVLRVRQGRLAEAEQHLRHMLSIDETDYRGHLMLARVLRKSGRVEEARRHARRARALDPNR